MYFDTINQLRNQPTPIPLNTEFIVSGYDTPGDGGEGTFIWVSVPPPASLPYPDDDGIIILSPNDSSGYFKRVFSGPINVRWFGAKGTGLVDDTDAVHRARDSKAFADNGTLYFPVGTYMGAFIFDNLPNVRNEINIIGDGHGSILKSDGTGDPVVVLGYKYPAWKWARFSNLAVVGRRISHQAVNGVEFANPSTAPNQDFDNAAGRWVLERVYFSQCKYGVYKKYGNIGNHFIDCTFSGNEIGVFAEAVPSVMHAGCDRYNGGHFDANKVAGLKYLNEAPQIIIDGTIFEFNSNAWAISIQLQGQARMNWNAICIRNAWFEGNGSDKGGDMEFEGVRSVRIDDCRIASRMHLRDSSVNLYNCQLSFHGADPLSDWYYVDEKSSLVAYELRYDGYPTNKVFVNSISYDGSQDIRHDNRQPTSVWGPLRSVKATMHDVIVSTHLDISGGTFSLISGGIGYTSAYVSPMHVLGKGSWKLDISGGTRIRSDDIVGTIRRDAKYIVWSIHTFLETPVPEGHSENEIFGDILVYRDVRLGSIYFKPHQWVCSYGMKLVNITHDSGIVLDFESAFDAAFYITDYQIVEFDSLHDANAYVNSREFAIYLDRKE